MSNSVVYLMSGAAHLPYLVVSLYSLRRFYGGDIEVHAWPESYDLARAICDDSRLDATAVLRTPEYRGKNAQFIDKLRLMRSFGDRKLRLYLDADTKINGRLDPLFESSGRSFKATQFCDWKSNVGVVKNRIGSLVGRQSINQASVEMLLQHAFPSVNGGVFLSTPKSPVLEVWEQWTSAVLDIFIADETILHVLQAECGVNMEVLTGGQWNCSPKFQPKYLHDDDVKIWHFHGDSNVRLNKSQKGIDLWYPTYRRCVQLNIGSMADWVGSIDNKYLKALEEYYGTLEARSLDAAK